MTERLINADALHTSLVKMNDFGELSAKKAIRMVSKAPTVEAIPVEWLKDQIEIASSNGEDDYANAIDWTVMKWQTEVEDGTE